MTFAHAYEIVVDNVGNVWTGYSRYEADAMFDAYVDNSKANYGRAAGVAVTLLCDNEPVREYAPNKAWE